MEDRGIPVEIFFAALLIQLYLNFRSEFKAISALSGSIKFPGLVPLP
jgi:hypothetical protein